MISTLPFNSTWLAGLLNKPNQESCGVVNGVEYVAKIVIPNYKKNIEKHFREIIQGNLQQECASLDIPLNFEHFGLVVKFKDPIELTLYDEELNLPDGLSDIMAKVGPIILKNAYFESTAREYGHRNRFPHLQFHIDRSEKQVTRYSLYTRNPFDDEQKHPRTASTLFIANIAAYLQALKQKDIERNAKRSQITSQLLFENENMENILGSVVLEQAWNEPEGTGEIAMIDNATVLHASYYRDAAHSGYKIGVRYLAGK